MSILTALLAPIAVAGLVLLPGCWITFQLPSLALSFWPRLWIGAALSPVVVLVQFYALRLLGVPFGAASWCMLLVNLGAGYSVVRAARGAPRPDPGLRAPILAVGIVCAGFLALYVPNGAFSGHVWMHADIVYQLANGALRPEAADLAGARLAYPWFGHVQQATMSYVMGQSPVFSYVWSNAAYLLIMLGLTWHVTAAVEGNAHARVWSLILLLFGVNFVGYWLRNLLPTDVVNRYNELFGDPRYAPWLRRFLFFEQPQQVLPTFMALLLLALEGRQAKLAGARWLLATLLLAGIGVIYPILFPAACSIVGALAVTSWFRSPSGRRDVIPLAAMIVVAAIATFGAVRWVTQDRVGSPDLRISDWHSMQIKSITLTIVLLPLLPGAALCLWRALRERFEPVLIMALTAAGCAGLYVVFFIAQGGQNEYKFVYPAAAALAPLAAVAMGPALARRGRQVLVPAVLGLIVLSSAGFHRWFNSERRQQAQWRHVQVEYGGFDLRLRTSERYAGVTAALLRTPATTVVVTRTTEMHLPTLTRRSLYAPYTNVRYQGFLNSDMFLQQEMGYPAAWLVGRRADLLDLFEPASSGARAAALTRIMTMGRPMAFIVDESANPDLDSVLQGQPGAAQLFQGQGFRVWLLPPAR